MQDHRGFQAVGVPRNRVVLELDGRSYLEGLAEQRGDGRKTEQPEEAECGCKGFLRHVGVLAKDAGDARAVSWGCWEGASRHCPRTERKLAHAKTQRGRIPPSSDLGVFAS